MDAVGPKMQADDQCAKTKPLVLLIHPDTAVEQACRNALERHGFEVEVASDGSHGIHEIYRLIPDVVVAGSATPELNGYQVCRLIKNDPVMKRIPVLLMAEQADKMDRFWSVKAGSDEFLQTDEVETKLLRKIQMLLEVYERMGVDEKRNLKAVFEKRPLKVRTRLGQIMDASLVESTLMVEFRSLADLVHDSSLLNYMLFSLLESLISNGQCRGLITGIGINILSHEKVLEGCEADARGNRPISLQEGLTPLHFSQWTPAQIAEELMTQVAMQVHFEYEKLWQGNAEYLLKEYSHYKIPEYPLPQELTAL
jgi:DNA-binding response OmpR family regulator